MEKNFRKKVAQCQKTERGDTLVLPDIGQRKNFLVQFPGPTGTIQDFVVLLVELFGSLQVYRKNTLTKSHDYSRLFSQEKSRQKSGPIALH